MMTGHGQPDVTHKILSRIGKPVSFQYPSGEPHMKGILKDRAVIDSNPSTAGVPYWDVVDLIHFPGSQEEDWIRIGYYRKRRHKNRLVWGSQTTITEPVSVWRRLLADAAREKPWFRSLIMDVAHDVASDLYTIRRPG